MEYFQTGSKQLITTFKISKLRQTPPLLLLTINSIFPIQPWRIIS